MNQFVYGKTAGCMLVAGAATLARSGIFGKPPEVHWPTWANVLAGVAFLVLWIWAEGKKEL